MKNLLAEDKDNLYSSDLKKMSNPKRHKNIKFTLFFYNVIV